MIESNTPTTCDYAINYKTVSSVEYIKWIDGILECNNFNGNYSPGIIGEYNSEIFYQLTTSEADKRLIYSSAILLDEITKLANNINYTSEYRTITTSIMNTFTDIQRNKFIVDASYLFTEYPFLEGIPVDQRNVLWVFKLLDGIIVEKYPRLLGSENIN